MNRKQIIEIATQVYGECEWHESALLHLELFAELVAAKEREACAKVCEEGGKDESGRTHVQAWGCAKAIRARGEA